MFCSSALNVSDRLTQQDGVAQIRFSTIKCELFLLEVKIKRPKSVRCKLIFLAHFRNLSVNIHTWYVADLASVRSSMPGVYGVSSRVFSP
jgi:hypothetical protein